MEAVALYFAEAGTAAVAAETVGVIEAGSIAAGTMPAATSLFTASNLSMVQRRPTTTVYKAHKQSYKADKTH